MCGAAAQRRAQMLIQAAANEWKVPASECTAANSIITHGPSGRKTSFGKVVHAAVKLEPPDPKGLKLKDPKSWRIAGKPIKRLDTMDKLTGKQKYSADTQLPGMLNAAIKACPVRGGKVVKFDAGKVRGMPGVKNVVQVGDTAVAVVADTWWHAKKALDVLPVTWDEGPGAKTSSATIKAFLEEGLEAETQLVGNRTGDINAALAGAAKKVEAVYSYPYQNHACMEPLNATVRYTADKCEIWTSTQNAEGVLAATVEASGLPFSKVEVTVVSAGGGFGRRGRADYVTQAVQIAKQMPGTPIKLLWSREEDMTQGTYHPITMCKMVGALDKDNNLVGLRMRISGQSILAGIAPDRLVKGMDPADLPGSQSWRRRRAVRLRHPEHPDRPCHAQSAHHAGILARREQQPERHLSRVLHRRGGARGRTGPARVPAQDDGEASRSTLRCSMPSPSASAGARRRRRACSAASRSRWATAATSPAAPKSRSRAMAC